MPSLEDHKSSEITKLLLIGDSGAGKTGSLISLIEAGYKLRIIDLDNGLDALVAFARRQCPDKLSNVEYETRRDKYKATPSGPIVAGMPLAYTDSFKLLTKWSDDTDPAEWGPEYVLVIDSLTQWGRAAFEWAKGMAPTVKDPRQWFYSGQRATEDAIALVSSEAFNTNVIIISHVTYVELNDGTQRGYPSAIGKELSKHVAKYFNTLVLCQSSGTGKNVKRRLHTLPTALIDVKNPAPFKMEDQYDITDGMARIFETLRSTES